MPRCCRAGAFALILFLLSNVDAIPLRKNLAGPPEEFGSKTIPLPYQSGQDQRSAFFNATFKEEFLHRRYVAHLELAVDSTEMFTFSVFAGSVVPEVKLRDPSGGEIDLGNATYPSAFPLYDNSGIEAPGRSFIVTDRPVGKYELELTVPSAKAVPNMTAVVLLFNDSPLRAFTTVYDYNTEIDRKIGLVTHATDDMLYVKRRQRPSVLRGVVLSADMQVSLPDGAHVQVKMRDDGHHHDGVADDGIYGGDIVAVSPGLYVASAVVRGQIDGVEFVRSTQHIISVVDDKIELTGKANMTLDADDRATIFLEVNMNSSSIYRPYAELWAVNANNQLVPVCWLSGLAEVVASPDGGFALPLQLDLRWAARIEVQGPFTLRNVYVQEMTTYVPLTQAQQITIVIDSLPIVRKAIRRLTALPNVRTEITEAMRWGVRPERFRTRPAAVNASSTEDAPVILLHGYCAGRNPWELHADYFPAGSFFLNAEANNPNDVFAQLVLAWADELKLASYAGIAHSQGGVVLLHMHNYYWSGLEVPKTTGRLLQSCGTPFNGVSAEGTTAAIIKRFGFGCGVNYDLTLDGAALWLAGISEAAKADVHYFTTTYRVDRRVGDWCCLPANSVLDWPNDGTTELSNGQLAGGNNHGNTEKYCHIDAMAYPGGYNNPVMLADMAANYAR